MLSSIFTVALLSATVFAADQEKRQATNAAQFTSAADQLISLYIPSTVLPAFESSVSSAASAAKITGDAKSLMYDALLASSIPGWFASAVPSDWSSQVAALESDISALRGPGTSATSVAVVIVVTTTNSAGSTITTSETTTAASATGSAATVTTTSTSGVVSTTTTTSGTGSSSGSTVNVGSTYSGLTTEVISGATSVFTTALSKVTSVAGGASSIVSVVTKSTSSGGGAIPTAVSGAAAGIAGLVGMMIAL